jgi:peptidoglycan/LPS O-acetylase OafA/YrhL
MPPPKGSGPAVAALVLGLLGCVVPLLPINLDHVRAYTPFPFAVAGIALAIVGFIGRRRGKPLAVAGAVLSVIALALGTIMVGGNVIDQSTQTGAAQVPGGYSAAACATIRTGPNSPVRT